MYIYIYTHLEHVKTNPRTLETRPLIFSLTGLLPASSETKQLC